MMGKDQELSYIPGKRYTLISNPGLLESKKDEFGDWDTFESEFDNFPPTPTLSKWSSKPDSVMPYQRK